jgi:tRNA 2-thiouridine synthesizing protein B
MISHDDGLLLCGDAVYTLQAGTDALRAIDSLPSSCEVLALAEDVQARNLSISLQRIRVIDYAEFVVACGRYERVNSWL